jgi:hypothetical protein
MLPKKLQLWADLAHLGFSLSTEYILLISSNSS